LSNSPLPVARQPAIHRAPAHAQRRRDILPRHRHACGDKPIVDSFACHTLRALAQVARLRGAHTVIVGIQPDVAIAMTRLGTTLHAVPTALGLEEGVDLLDSIDVARGVDDGPRRD
jgi:hypothetical protein